MDDSDPIPDLNSSDPSVNAVQSHPDSDFGPWLLVSRRRGSVRGRGDGARAGHVNHNAAAAPSTEGELSRGTTFRSVRGGRAHGSSGRHTNSQATFSATTVNEQLPTPINHTSHSLPVALPLPNVQKEDSHRSLGADLSHLSALPPNSTSQIVPFHKTLNSFKDTRSTSPPPVLRSSVLSPSPLFLTQTLVLTSPWLNKLMQLLKTMVWMMITAKRMSILMMTMMMRCPPRSLRRTTRMTP